MSSSMERFAAALASQYRIDRELGQGGMATVYLAEDVRHRRKVALKVLHPELSAVLGPERFLKEIELTASLQHPHILPLFDSGSSEGQLFYVMPFVEGETLRSRLERERQLPVAEALQIAREVADALQYAHERGVIHRDIKPENILLQGGHALVADFGIALAVQQAGGQRMTQTGLSLGTPQYMAPEQAMGDKNVDARADIYALGAVIYEMLAGEPPFTGPTAQAIVAKVITEKPTPLVRVRDSVPAHVDSAIAQALAKLPADRPSSARELAGALQSPSFTWGVPSATPAPTVAARGAPGLARTALLAGTALALLGMAAAVWAWRHSQESEPRRLVALSLEVPTANPELSRFGVSPDGARFAFSTAEGLVVRDAGQREYRLFPETQEAESPSFSPDGQWIAFHSNGHLRKIAVAGGSALALVPGDSLLAGRVSWGEDGSIAFESGNRLYLIPPGGGAPRQLKGARVAAAPRITPDGRGVLYVDEQSGSKLMYYDLAADSAFTVLDEAAEGQYLPTGHIVYGHPNGGLFAVRYDVRHHVVLGTPIPIVPDAQMTGHAAPFVITRNGTLVYRAGVEPDYRLLARDPGGRIDTLPISPKIASYARFSPDGRSLALTFGAARGTNRHTAIYDLGLGTLTRFTLEGGGHSPVWSPDGMHLAFTAEAEGTDAEDIFVQPVDRSTVPVRIIRMPNDQHGWSWPSDSVLVFASNAIPRGLRGAGFSGGSIAIADPRHPDAAPRMFLESQEGVNTPIVSPDGRYIAFTANENGTSEIYVRPFPSGAGGQWRISAKGGQQPRWSGDGRTVFYLGTDLETIHAVHVNPGPPFTVGSSEIVATVPRLGEAWDVDRRSGRMVLTQTVETQKTRIIVLMNWVDEFRRTAAANR
jgi:Tol biopolymer transport system component/tRNA A-37 threonylcarbamoyl transferase component Bud32